MKSMNLTSFQKWAVGLPLAALTVYAALLARNAWKEHAYIGRPEAQRDTISISATGKSVGVPDIASVTLGVQTEKRTVAAAQEENTRKMNAVIAKLKELGIAEKDVRTVNYSVYPVYDWRDGSQIERGFMVSQNVEVKVRDLSLAGTMLAASTELGANQIGGLAFTIDEPEEIEQEARLEALGKAREKAAAVAEASGVRLGKVVGFSESMGQPAPFYYRSYAEGIPLGAGGGAPDVEPGSQEVVVQVFVEYEILP
jgi:hypothetical protein